MAPLCLVTASTLDRCQWLDDNCYNPGGVTRVEKDGREQFLGILRARVLGSPKTAEAVSAVLTSGD